ncbi:MAG: alpha/beta hydrolase [Pseudonocardia sp.]|nr:alpha/beta hydrolase [Pseudonocardia sp.]MBO0873523.1 alpha/beta hydrolase [Pseudonocardia sp.]
MIGTALGTKLGSGVAALALVVGVAACAGSSTPVPAAPAPGASATGTAPPGPAVEQGSVAVDGGAIHYTRAGSGPPLLLLHGWPQTSHEWYKTMPELADGHTVIAVDLPGLGESSVPSAGYDKATTARRVHEAVQRLGYREISILAHDVGGMVGFYYARDFPTEVSRLMVIEAPLPGPAVDQIKLYSWHILFNSSPAPIPERLIDDKDVSTYLGMLFGSGLSPAEQETYFQAYSDPTRRHAGYEYYRAMATDAEDIQRNAAAKPLAMPVLAVGAERGIGAMVAESFRPVARDLRAATAPGSGHFVPEQNPRFVIDCARLFFDGAQAGTAPRPELTGCAR